MFGFDYAQIDYKRVQQSDNQAEFSHELIAGAGSFAAFKRTISVTKVHRSPLSPFSLSLE